MNRNEIPEPKSASSLFSVIIDDSLTLTLRQLRAFGDYIYRSEKPIVKGRHSRIG